MGKRDVNRNHEVIMHTKNRRDPDTSYVNISIQLVSAANALCIRWLATAVCGINLRDYDTEGIAATP